MNLLETELARRDRECSKPEIQSVPSALPTTETQGQSARSSLATGSNQPSEVDELAWKIVKLKLQLSRVERGARAVIRSARRASSGQDLVLRETLLELAREVGEPLNTA